MKTLMLGLMSLNLLVWSIPLSAQDETKAIVCKQTYALCSAAKCTPNPRDNKKAICYCDNYDGLSAGTVSCEKRKPYQDSMGVMHVVSTFSFENDKLKGMTCPSGTRWTNCVNAPCTIDPTDSKKSICNCPIVATGEIIVFGANCNKHTGENNFWSGALTTSHNFLGEALAKAKKIAPVKFDMCQP